MTAIVLRSYASRVSEDVARVLAELLDVEPNAPDLFPQGVDDDGVERWYRAVRARIEEASAVIVLLTTELNDIMPGNLRGEGLLREVLAFWSEPARADPAKLVFICIDCDPDDLRSRPGGYEQLQDIIVRLAKKTGPIRVDSRALLDSSEARSALQHAVARRLQKFTANR